MKYRFPRIAVRSDGFSLVEVAVSLAVIVIVLTGIAGVWPNGQDRFKGAMDMTLAAHLAQRISGEVELEDFSEVLRLAGMTGDPAPPMGSLPRRYFSYIGREVTRGDPDRIYEVLTRVSRQEQLPVQGVNGAGRWNAKGQLVLAIQIVTAPSGTETPVGVDGLVDRAKCRRSVVTFPFIVGGHSSW